MSETGHKRHRCRAARQVGLEDPGDVDPDQGARRAREHEGPERVAGSDVAGVHQRVSGRQFAAASANAT